MGRHTYIVFYTLTLFILYFTITYYPIWFYNLPSISIFDHWLKIGSIIAIAGGVGFWIGIIIYTPKLHLKGVLIGAFFTFAASYSFYKSLDVFKISWIILPLLIGIVSLTGAPKFACAERARRLDDQDDSIDYDSLEELDIGTMEAKIFLQENNETVNEHAIINIDQNGYHFKIYTNKNEENQIAIEKDFKSRPQLERYMDMHTKFRMNDFKQI